ncbi:MAG: tetratricopeptide repeat protein [Microbacterium sp.]|uniref:tetratricopeptide repeat protein n=2 Tax=Bacteria TaxID=2 RepID=UPI0025DCA967|nr:tetratricopeptide repeat protein [Microbacterium sp.]MBQ9916548.1 tetratricopeptide repeat protein [Microbacterium sp.]
MPEVEPLERARLYLQAGRPIEARTQLRAILAESPTDARAHLLSARAEILLGDPPSAEAHARAATADPDVRAVAFGVLSEIVGLDPLRKAEAVDLASAAVRADPADWQLRGILGRSLARTGDLGNAWAQAEEGVRLAPNDPSSRARALVDLARVPLADRRGGQRMRAIMRDAAALDPTDPEVVSMLAVAQLHAGRRREAIATSLGVLRSSPTDRFPVVVARVAMHAIVARFSLVLLGVGLLAPVAAGLVARGTVSGTPARVGGAVGLTAIAVAVTLMVRSLTRAIDRRRLWTLVRRQAGFWVGVAAVAIAVVIYAVGLIFGVFLLPLPLLAFLVVVLIYRWSSPR